MNIDDLEEKQEQNEEIVNENEILIQNINKKIKIIASILLVCILTVIVISAWSSIAPDKMSDTVKNNISANKDEKSFPVAIVGTDIQNNNFKLWNNNLSYVSDTSLVSLNKEGKKNIERQISYASPIIVTSGIYNLTYNLGGTGIMIDTAEDTIYKSKEKDVVEDAENNKTGVMTDAESLLKNKIKDIIIDADINSDGMYAVATQSSEYLSKLTVYNKDNSQKYAYYFAKHYVTTISLNSDGTQVAVSGVTSVNGTLESVVYILDVNSEEPKEIIRIGENLPLDISFLNNNNIVLIGDKEAMVIKSGEDMNKYDYQDLTLTSFEIDKQQGAVLSLSRTGDGRNCDIIYMHKDKNINEAISTEYKITDISMFGKKFSVLSEGKIYLYDKFNNIVSEGEAGVDSKAICMINESTANILGVSEIRNLKL